MSRLTALAMACALLAGCDDGSNNVGYGYDYDYKSALGIKIRCDYDASCPTGDEADKALRAAGLCLGVSYAEHAKDLMVIGTDKVPDNNLGMYFAGYNLVVVQQVADVLSREEVIAHEMAHHLLYKITGDPDNNHQNGCLQGFALYMCLMDEAMCGA